jgi:uncharacterized oligopeptide transporter (OPT) family protein
VPPSEHLHWMYAGAFLLLGLCLAAQAIVGDEVWNRRPWRRYLWPGLGFGMGVLLWPAMVFPMTSPVHLLAHGTWVETMTLAGMAHLGMARGKLVSPYWRLTMPLALAASGVAFLAHERNGWLYARSAFVHHVCGWTLIVGAAVALVQIVKPRSLLIRSAFALTFVVLAVGLFSSRDTAPVFGHLSPGAGSPHR